ncbi:MAG: chromate resistance protein ChrB [Actinomycetota bacterium]|nr:chromate resistance protein ChrB [Actinomycetota bacterium]
MEWLIISYRLPAEPSRHRVAVWRELRRLGAVPLQQATWAVPSRPVFAEGVQHAVALVERAEGEVVLLRGAPFDDTHAARLERLFTEAREAEWIEFLSDCDKLDREITGEIGKEKFTPAELDEEEQSLERLRRWYREIRAKDVFQAPSAELAERRLKACAETLEEFADRVYEAGGAP